MLLHGNQKDYLMKKITIDKTTAIVRPKLEYYNARTDVKFDGSLLGQNNVTYNHAPIVNIYIVYKISSTDNSSMTLENCLFGAKYKYSGYGICFDSSGSYTHPDGGIGKNLIIFGGDMTGSKHASNKTESVLVLGQDSTQKNKRQNNLCKRDVFT